jgi:RNA polymerase sigma-70 factor, ECF subfamily
MLWRAFEPRLRSVLEGAYPAREVGASVSSTSEAQRADRSAAATERLEKNEADAALVRRIARGDKGALSELYDGYGPQLLALGVRILGQRSEAEDLLHDVLLEVWRRAGDYDPARGTVRAWLCLRLRSRALDRKKSPRLARAVAWDDARAEETAAPARDPGLRMERMRVRGALAALSSEQRDVVDLCYFRGLSTAEAAERLACPVGTVKSRLSAARDRLRAALDGAGGPS